MTKDTQAWVLLAMAGTIVVGLTLWRMGLITLTEEPLVFPAEVPAVPADSPAPASEPRVEYPLTAPQTAHGLSGAELRRALIELLGGRDAASLLQLEDFPHRFVATVDNLGRSHAPPLVWPVNPTPDRFTVDEREGDPVVAADNASRYTPFVLVAEAVDARRAVDLYLRMYPALQRAYEELGFPHRYFNDRLIEVIDLLLATPQAEYPLQLRLTQVKGPVESLRPWVRYEFADPQLESLAAGQKIMLRVGPVNQRRLKAKLTEIRRELVARIRTR
jgi:Protein of unknown function (DUF3014).